MVKKSKKISETTFRDGKIAEKVICTNKESPKNHIPKKPRKKCSQSIATDSFEASGMTVYILQL